MDSAKRLPGLGIVVYERRLKAAIANLRQCVPIDVRRAAQIMDEQEGLVNQAAKEATRTSAAAEEEFASKVKTSPVVRAAEKRAKETLTAVQERANAILTEAEREANTRRDETKKYAVMVLRGLDTQLNGLADSVRKGVALLQRQAGPFQDPSRRTK